MKAKKSTSRVSPPGLCLPTQTQHFSSSTPSAITAALDDAWGALERGSDDVWSPTQEAGGELWGAPWESEYSRGCTHEIYRVTLTPRLARQNFVEAAASVYAVRPRPALNWAPRDEIYRLRTHSTHTGR